MATTEELVRISGQAHEILKRVGNDSLAASDVRRALQDIIEGKFGQSEPIQEMFVSADIQLANVRRWNEERNWGFTEEQIRRAAQEVPVLYREPLVPVVLVPYLKTVQATLEELWTVGCSAVQPDKGRYKELKSDKKHLRLLDGITHEPGLRWEVIDLGANWDSQNGTRPIDVRNQNSAHAGVLAAAAHFPKWVQAMDGKKVPYACMPGYQVTLPGFEAWRSLPCLFWHRSYREVRLHAYWDDYRNDNWACPVVVLRES